MTPRTTLATLHARHRYLVHRWATSLVLFPFAVMFALRGGGVWLGEALWMLLSAFNLITHEAGHFFFRFFGRFMMFAGGTILELGVAALFVFQGVYWHSKLGTQLALLWLGQVFAGVSIYAADAQARALPLLGNLGPESHDWYNMLAMLGLLERAPLVSGTLFALAACCWLAMLLVPAVID